ncbi:hypothetical protein YC2023_064121 [Brassica napus]
MRLGLEVKEVRNFVFEFRSGGGSLWRNCFKAPTIVEGQRSCKRQPNSGRKYCMKDNECRKVCIEAEKATRATCDYTFPRRRCFCHFPYDISDKRRRKMRLGLEVKEVRNFVFEFRSGGGSLWRNCFKAPTIVEGQRSCKRQPNSGRKYCMKDNECRKVCIEAEKATRATCDYTFPRRRCFCHFPWSNQNTSMNSDNWKKL